MSFEPLLYLFQLADVFGTPRIVPQASRWDAADQRRGCRACPSPPRTPRTRGLHSSTSQLNLSVFMG